MSSKTPKTPAYQASAVYQNGVEVGKTYMGKDGVIRTEYYLAPEEEATKKWADEQKQIIEQRLYNPTEDDRNSWLNYANERKDLFRKQYDELATDNQRKAIENIANRFGTLNTSATADTMSKLQNINNEAYSDIARQYDADLQNQEDAYNNRQMNLLNYLNGNLSQINQNGYNAINTSNNLTNSGNSFNLSNYQNQLAAAQMQNQAVQGYLNTGAQLAGAAIMSDERLKENIRLIGQRNGFNWYEFDYKEGYGLPTGKQQGVIAQEVEEVMPEAVMEDQNGYKMVNYEMIGGIAI
jgi:hypothetical protein